MADPKSNAQPILNLDTLTGPLAVVKIDGVAYALKTADQLPLAGYHACQQAASRLDALWQRPVLAPDEEQELSALLDRVTRVVLDAPEDVHRKLTDLQRLTISETFIRLPLPSLRSLGAAIARPSRSTGDKSSPSSPASTPGPIPGAGTPKSRSRSSARAN